MQTAAPVIPIAVWGAHRLATKGRPRNFERGVEILVNIGREVPIDPDLDPRVGTDHLMDRIRELLADAQARYRQIPRDETDRWWLPAHLGGTAPLPEEIKEREEGAGLE
jgi:hypothetical protein